MNAQPDWKSLVRDVFAEGRPPGGKELWLRESIRLSRRRRLERRVNASIVACALVASSVFLAWKLRPVHRAEAMAALRNYTLIITKPLAPYAFVETKPLNASYLVTSSMPASVVHTSQGQFNAIDDAELLAFASPGPVILVRGFGGTEQLVFLDPK